MKLEQTDNYKFVTNQRNHHRKNGEAMNEYTRDFWLFFLAKAGDVIPQYRGVRPTDKHYLHIKKGSDYPFVTVVKKNESHVEICFQEKTELESNQKFNQLFKYKDAIERKFEDNLRWELAPEKKRSKIMTKPIQGGYMDKESWEELVKNLLDEMKRFMTATQNFAS